MIRVLSASLCCVIISTASAQVPKKNPPRDQIGDKRTDPEVAPGFRKRVIEGFTLHVSDEVFSADVSKYEKKPFDVLEQELQVMARVLTPKTLATLRKSPVWIEWDAAFDNPNSKGGSAVAFYRGVGGSNPRAGSVTVNSLQSLTREHQPKNDSGRCVLLHEFAHALHDQYFGYGNAQISNMYKQAMDRKLYPKEMYAAANEKEFFAEMTSAYLDRISDFPHTRAELKKHDAATYRVMTQLWGTLSKRVALVAPTEDDGRKTFEFDLTPQKLNISGDLHGPKWDPDSLKGRPVLVVSWLPEQPSSISLVAKLMKWQQELGRHGLVIQLASHFIVPPEQIKQAAEQRSLPFGVASKMILAQPRVSTMIPHAIVFDADGNVKFRGSAFDAEPFVRRAVGESLAEALELVEIDAAVKPAAEAILKGDSPEDVLPKLLQLVGRKGEAGDNARELARAILAGPTKLIEEAEKLAETNPWEAFLRGEKIGKGYGGTAIGRRLDALGVKLRSNKEVALELRARAAFEPVRKIEAGLSAQPRAFDPTRAQFRADNAAAIADLEKAFAAMKKYFAKTRTFAEAEKLTAPYLDS